MKTFLGLISCRMYDRSLYYSSFIVSTYINLSKFFKYPLDWRANAAFKFGVVD